MQFMNSRRTISVITSIVLAIMMTLFGSLLIIKMRNQKIRDIVKQNNQMNIFCSKVSYVISANDTGVLPKNLDQSILVLVESPTESYFVKEYASLIVSRKDIWGSEYRFVIKSDTESWLISCGPNNKYEEGKGDDIVGKIELYGNR